LGNLNFREGKFTGLKFGQLDAGLFTTRIQGLPGVG
jgi:hypothetical protein